MGPRTLIAMLVVSVASLGCKRRSDVQDWLQLPDPQAAARPPADSLPGTLVHLESALQQPLASLPDWLDDCTVWQQPVDPGLGDSARVALICGPHAVLIASVDQRVSPATDAQARAQARALLLDVVGAAEVIREHLPGRDGTLGVDVLRAQGDVVAMAAGSEAGGRAIGLACGGPEAVSSREAFCRAVVASMLAVPTPAVGGGGSEPVEVAVGPTPSDAARDYFERVEPAVPLGTWTAVLGPARVTAEGRFSGDADEARRLAAWIVGSSILMQCLSLQPDTLRRYARRATIDLAWLPDEGIPTWIAADDERMLHCVGRGASDLHPRSNLHPRVRPPTEPVRLRLELEVVRREY